MYFNDFSDNILFCFKQLILFIYRYDIYFIYTYRFNDREFILDTRQFREILGDVPLNSYEVSEYIKEYLAENKLDTDGGVVI